MLNRGNFLFQGPKPDFYPISAKTTKNNFAQGVVYELEALIVAALGGLVYFMTICVEISVKISVGAFFSQQ